MCIDVFNCTYSSFGCSFPVGMRRQSATIRQLPLKGLLEEEEETGSF